MMDPQQVLDAARAAIAELNALGIEVPRGVRETEQLALLAVRGQLLAEAFERMQNNTTVGGSFCSHCGYQATAADDESAVNEIKAHIAQCEHHPMRPLIDACRAADHVLSSLLAIREGASDALLLNVQRALRGAMQNAGVVIKTQEAGPACGG